MASREEVWVFPLLLRNEPVGVRPQTTAQLGRKQSLHYRYR